MYRENIFGLPDCQLPSGGLCNVCCTYMRVVTLNKEPNIPCHLLGAQGCAVHNTTDQPGECSQFHCSDLSNNMIHGLISKAYELGLITAEEEVNAKKLWITS